DRAMDNGGRQAGSEGRTPSGLAGGIPDRLPPFAVWPAFPAADYYDGSDAPQVSPADRWPPLQRGLSRSWSRTLRGHLGGGSRRPDPLSAESRNAGGVVQVARRFLARCAGARPGWRWAGTMTTGTPVSPSPIRGSYTGSWSVGPTGDGDYLFRRS